MTEFYPEDFARFYDLIYHQIRDTADSDFFNEKIRQTKGRILEVGVGTGRLFMNGLENNADIYGIDISPAMLDILRKKLSPENQKRISIQNIIDFKSDKKFDLILAPFRVFMHLTEKTEQMKALNNVYDNLNQNGVFIFDTFIPDLKMIISGLDNVVDFDGEFEPGNRVKRIVTTKPDLINQLINITFRMEWNEGESNFSSEWKTRLRYFFRFELEHLIERTKFSKYRISGDFLNNDLDNTSKEFIVTCQK